jgi:hypothetical protein
LYLFEDPKAFNGGFIYNPYQISDSLNFYKVLFARPTATIKDIFRQNSQFMSNNTTNGFSGFDHEEVVLRQNLFWNAGNKNGFQTYMHGLGFNDPSMLCMGAQKKLWIDYPLFKNLHHKQGLIDKLLKDCEMVVLNPVSFSHEDMKYLSGYQLIDLNSKTHNAIALWDSALSNGHLVYGFVSEEIPEFSPAYDKNPGFLLINADSNSIISLMDAIKNGRSFSVISNQEEEKTPDEELLKDFRLKLNLIADTIHIESSDSAILFKFIGQNGKLIHFVENTSNAACFFRPEDSYIRTEILLSDGTKIFLNPLIRHYAEEAERQRLSVMDTEKTAMLRGAYIILIVLLLQMIFKWQMRKLHQNH